MGYATREDTEFWGQFTSTDFGTTPGDWNYEASLDRLLDFASSQIDSYCRVPKDFFIAGGVAIQNEYHNGKDVPSGNKPLLRPDYLPVLSVIKLEYLESGSWTTKTEGNSNDYIVLDEGIILVTKPDRTEYKNIRLTYKCGYTSTPDIVVTVSGRLAGAIGQRIKDSANREAFSVGGLTSSVSELVNLSKAAFTDELKQLLKDYRFKQIQVYRG